MRGGRLVRGVSLVVAGLGLALVPGCLPTLVNASGSKTHTGEFVSRDAFGQVRTGKTTQAAVLAMLGEPTSRATDDYGHEVWAWRYEERKQSSGEVLLLFDISNHKVTPGAAFIEFQDGVVTRKWRD